ncbi:sarcosine oxidase subunit gamma [Szabonella alba]|uniref:Sarcosine oxidase subunit gamma n=1 Tax=Szabonella alba TaxID=2804194 RepID=A0A8K0VGA2_9RHOB|nr:sarcosine oxidase subunit gamma [Szabonella alba]MBL4918837.1 sarcosine oxidase subunit gamma [Szabonella alba]
MAEILQAMTALGAHGPARVAVGPLSITERVDLALASVAERRGRGADLVGAASPAGLPLPGPARYQAGTPFGTFWVAPGMWFAEAPFASHEWIADQLRAALGDAASITEQTDAWVIFDLVVVGEGVGLASLLERLCNVDFPAAPDGFATRTVMDHLGIYLIRQGAGAARIYGPRSSAQSLLHALEAAARAVW